MHHSSALRNHDGVPSRTYNAGVVTINAGVLPVQLPVLVQRVGKSCSTVSKVQKHLVPNMASGHFKGGCMNMARHRLIHDSRDMFGFPQPSTSPGKKHRQCSSRSTMGYAFGRSSPSEAHRLPVPQPTTTTGGSDAHLFRVMSCVANNRPPVIVFSSHALEEVICKSRAQKRARPSAGDGNPKFPLPITKLLFFFLRIFLNDTPTSSSNAGTEASLTTGAPHRTARPA